MRATRTAFAGSTTYYLARDIVTQLFSIYALKMAAVFLLSQATLWLRTKVMPRWITLITFLAGLVLLIVFSQSFWAVLVFPAWVFLVSVYILVGSRFRRRHAATEVTARTRRSRTTPVHPTTPVRPSDDAHEDRVKSPRTLGRLFGRETVGPDRKAGVVLESRAHPTPWPRGSGRESIRSTPCTG